MASSAAHKAAFLFVSPLKVARVGLVTIILLASHVEKEVFVATTKVITAVSDAIALPGPSGPSCLLWKPWGAGLSEGPSNTKEQGSRGDKF